MTTIPPVSIAKISGCRQLTASRHPLRKNLVCLLLGSALSLASAGAESCQWSGPASGNWNDTGNWTPSQVPGSGDTATIPGGGVAIVIDTAVSISGLTVGGGSSLTVAADGVLNILGNLTLNGALTNAGTVNWQDGQISVSQNSSWGYTGEITNQADGLFDIRCDQALINGFYGNPQFHNSGTLRKSAGTGATEFSVYFDNSGTVEAQAGLLHFNSGANLGGRFQADTDVAIEFAGGSVAAPPTIDFQGPGQVRITAANVALNGLSGVMDLYGSTVTGAVATGGILSLHAGTCTSLTVGDGGTFNFDGGWLSSGASLAVASGGELNITGTLYLLGPLTNAGTVNWQDGQIIIYQHSYDGWFGEIINQAEGIFDIRCDQPLSQYDSDLPQFHNAGTLRKSAGTGTTEFSVYFDNSGAVEFLFTISENKPVGMFIAGNTPVSLVGTFTVRLEDGYRPNPGDTFPVLRYPGAVGDFTFLNGLDLGNGLRLEPHFTKRGLTLVATPYVEDDTPTPSMIRANTGVVISWPDGFSGWQLYRSTDLITWEPTSVTGINNTVRPSTETGEYFRLKKEN